MTVGSFLRGLRTLEHDEGIVHVLDEQVASQIAAGEVVERPASVVKELIENALDAGAKRITIDIAGGGRELVRVSDDGCGMSPRDAEMCLRRHATSKIRTIKDLDNISTFGFRGEALASIASVSRLELRTRRPQDEFGFVVRAVGGEGVEAAQCAMAPGTQVEARDLFFNTPARLKFLKSAIAEHAAITDCVERLALCRPDVSFRLNNNQRERLDFPRASSLLERIRQVFGDKFANELVSFKFAAERLLVRGFASRPTLSFASSRMMFVFVNGRPVRDKLLSRAVVQAYAGLLPRDRFPAVALFVDLPAHEVDVNVHPMKLEVRFRYPGAIFEASYRALRDALAGQEAATDGDDLDVTHLGPLVCSAETEVRGSASDKAEGTSSGAQLLSAPPSQPGLRLVVDRSPGQVSAPQRASVSSSYAFSPALLNMPNRTEAIDQPSVPTSFSFAELRLLGQLLASYIVLEGHDGLLLVDQHAAHERITYEKLRAEFKSGGIKIQPRLVPYPLEVSGELALEVTSAVSAFRTLGFDLEAFGGRTVVLRGSPALFGPEEGVRLFRDLLDSVGSDGFAVDNLAACEAKLKLLACHGSIRAGKTLSQEEMAALLRELDQTPFNTNCPHGRPVFVRFGLNQIERLFRR